MSTITIETQCIKAKKATDQLLQLTTTEKNNLLEEMSNSLMTNTKKIIEKNQKDIINGQKNGLSNSLIDRLTLNESRIKDIATSLITIKNLEDPIHTIIDEWTRPNNLNIQKVRVPFGVIGIIYEARPNVTVDAIGLAIKSSNAIVLRGSSSAYYSNKVLSDLLKEVLKNNNLNPDAIQLLEDTSREGVIPFVQMKGYLDLVIPRGSAGLINTVVTNATVPSIETGVGNCHVYIHEDASYTLSEAIAINSSTQRVSVCNSCESIVIHKEWGTENITNLLQSFIDKNVTVRGCNLTQKLHSEIEEANESDWSEEYLDYTISCKIVNSLDDAIEHINTYGSMHTECIISNDEHAVTNFNKRVDASSILNNASTRFTDGGEFGFGAEMGISTQKCHARGPMGLNELTTYKYIVKGNGQLK